VDALKNVMTKELEDTLEAWLRKNRDSMVEDIVELSRVRSVVGPPEGEYPFGAECARVLEVAGQIARRRGFKLDNHAHYCATTVLPGRTDRTIGMFGHLDVVPEGSGWSTPPFSPVIKGGHIFARGPGDNKGPSVAALCLLQFIREQDVKLDHSLMLYYGTCEEAGMDDIEWYLKHFAPPEISVVPDGTFPVCNGEKGRLTANLATDISGSNIVSFIGGTTVNAVPERASIVLRGPSLGEARGAMEDGFTIEATPKGVRIDAKGVLAHAAHPEEGMSAIHKLASAVAASGLANERGTSILSALSEAFASPYGAGLGILYEDSLSGPLTAVGGLVSTEGERLTQSLDVRFPITVAGEDVLNALKRKMMSVGFTVEGAKIKTPHYLPPDTPIVALLTDTFREFFGEDLPPFVSGGGTYAGKLPNAVAFGARLVSRRRPGGDTRGGGHQVDECVSIEGMEDMIRVYLRSMFRLDRL
jgi:succinyl-diaminopimelate desuccinylase